jgi:hypothetical protein
LRRVAAEIIGEMILVWWLVSWKARQLPARTCKKTRSIGAVGAAKRISPWPQHAMPPW